MIRALVDTNLLLDVFFQREPFLTASAEIGLASELGQFEGYVSAITPVNVYYIARKAKQDKKTARTLVIETLKVFRVCSIGFSELQTALSFPMDDYEDAVQAASAQGVQIDAIITRNKKDFAQAPVPAYLPLEFLQKLKT